MSIMIRDETFTGKMLQEYKITFLAERVTVAEVIARRVRDEVTRYNEKTNGLFNGLVEPTDAEKTLNGYKLTPKKGINADEQIKIALQAFKKNGFFMLADSQQLESLSQELIVADTTTISFIKLTALVGG